MENLKLDDNYVVLSLRQLALLKQRLVNLKKDLELSRVQKADDIVRERRETCFKIDNIISGIHYLAGSDTIWQEDFEKTIIRGK